MSWHVSTNSMKIVCVRHKDTVYFWGITLLAVTEPVLLFETPVPKCFRNKSKKKAGASLKNAQREFIEVGMPRLIRSLCVAIVKRKKYLRKQYCDQVTCRKQRQLPLNDLYCLLQKIDGLSDVARHMKLRNYNKQKKRR